MPFTTVFKLPQIFAKKGLEFFLKNEDIQTFVYYMTAFILCLASAKIISKNKGCKWGAIILVGSNYIKIIFALFGYQVVIQIWFTKIQVWKPSLKKMLFWLFYCWRRQNLDWELYLIFDNVYLYLHKELKQLFDRCRCCERRCRLWNVRWY